VPPTPKQPHQLSRQAAQQLSADGELMLVRVRELVAAGVPQPAAIRRAVADFTRPPPDTRLFVPPLSPAEMKVVLATPLAPSTPRAPVLEPEGKPVHPQPSAYSYDIPAPPRVNAAAEREDQLKFCHKWYLSALGSRGIKLKGSRLGGQTKGYFEDALDIFLEQEVSPAAWVAWALDRTLMALPTNARKRYVPRVGLLLSPKLLTEGRWQFLEAEADYSCPRFVVSTEGRRFTDAYRRMAWQVDMLPKAAQSPAVIAAIVAKHFPEGYREAVAKSRENARAEGQVYVERMRLGHWIWPIPRNRKAVTG